jgi:hypothetical protein
MRPMDSPVCRRDRILAGQNKRPAGIFYLDEVIKSPHDIGVG